MAWAVSLVLKEVSEMHEDYKGYVLDYDRGCNEDERLMNYLDNMLKSGRFDNIITFYGHVPKDRLEFCVGIDRHDAVKEVIRYEEVLEDFPEERDRHNRRSDCSSKLAISLTIDSLSGTWDMIVWLYFVDYVGKETRVLAESVSSRMYYKDEHFDDYPTPPPEFDYMPDDYRITDMSCFIALARYLVVSRFEKNIKEAFSKKRSFRPDGRWMNDDVVSGNLDDLFIE